MGGFNSMGGRLQVRSPSPHHRKSYSLGRLNDGLKTVECSSSENSNETKMDDGCRNKVMVVVDSSIESNGALQWALDHTVQNQDTIILIHVAIASKLGKFITLVSNFLWVSLGGRDSKKVRTRRKTQNP